MSDAVEQFEQGLKDIEMRFASAYEAAADEQNLRDINAGFVGGQGALTKLMKLMKDLPGDRRREFGQAANALKTKVLSAFEARLEAIAAAEREAELTGPAIDVTMPSSAGTPGRLHPVTRVKHELLDIFASLGFEQADGPEIDHFANCFDKLGFPPDHPATDEHDTFFVAGSEGRALLRTHTSTIQVRTMEARKPPLAVVAPGVVYRRDDDATHSPMFHQIEGFLVDEGVTFAGLKGVLTVFLERLLGDDIEVRFRPSYFPFVEPGAEVDVRRKNDGTPGPWMEVLGCGMIHPVVFEAVGYDPDAVTGFAFGMGLDRLAMVRYGIPNIKALYDNDVRFLGAF
ncbi:MAG: phenylalanine--tRNA ligase subunit alpha [Myxococcota bacterium]